MEKMSFISYPLASWAICFVSEQRQWAMPCNSATVPQLFTGSSPSPSLLLHFQSAPGDRLLLFEERQLSIPCLICSFCTAVTFASMRASRFQQKVAGGKAFSKMGSLPHQRSLPWIVLPHLLSCQGHLLSQDFACRCQKLQHFTVTCLPLRSLQQHYGVTERQGLEGTSVDHLVQLSS